MKNLDLIDLEKMLRERIQAHADKNQISFEEASKKVFMIIEGHCIDFTSGMETASPSLFQ